MDLNRILKLSVIFQLAIIILAIIAGLVEESYLPTELATYVKNREAGGLSAVQKAAAVMMGPFLISYLAASIALLARKTWAPVTYLYSVIFLTILSSLMAPSIITPLTSLLETVSDVIAGITICLVYFTPLKEEFKKLPQGT